MDTRRSRGRDPRGEDRGREGRGRGERKKGRERNNQRERPWGGRQGRWLGGAGKREGGGRKIEPERGGWVGKDNIHASWEERQRWGSGQPGVTETKTRSSEGKERKNHTIYFLAHVHSACV